MRVLILAGDSDGNLGDLAIVTATCAALRRARPDIEIFLVTSRRRRDQSRLGITPVPRGWRGIPALLRAARAADFVIFGGGGLLQDDDSLIKVPYWTARLTLVRLFARRVEGLSIGAGPLDYRISRACAALALKSMHRVSVRDDIARTTLQSECSRKIDVVPDPAFLLAPASTELARNLLADAGIPLSPQPLIGVAARRWFHTQSDLIPHKLAGGLPWRKSRGRQKMAMLTQYIAAALDATISHTGAHVVFLPTYNVGHEADADVCRAIAARMQSGQRSVLIIDDPAVYKAVAAQMHVMLCGRMHPAILAAGGKVPIVGLAYNQKFRGTFRLLDQEHRCVELTDIVANGDFKSLAAMLTEAIDSPDGLRPDTASLERRTADYIESLLQDTPRHPNDIPTGPDAA